MLNISYIWSPLNNVVNQSIDSTDVIKAWNLDSNLSSVIKHIKRAAHNSLSLEDLKKAEWHLTRAWTKKMNYHLQNLNTQQVQLEQVAFQPQTVCENWGLTDLLCSTLINIYFAQQHQPHILKQKALLSALNCLREEIVFLEQKTKLKVNVKLLKHEKSYA